MSIAIAVVVTVVVIALWAAMTVNAFDLWAVADVLFPVIGTVLLVLVSLYGLYGVWVWALAA